MKIRLETRDRRLVHRTTLPETQYTPELVSWGSRIFSHIGKYVDTNEVVYREALVVTLVDPVLNAAVNDVQGFATEPL